LDNQSLLQNHNLSNASENTDIEDIFKLNLDIQIQYRLENLDFLKNIEIAIKVLDEPTKQFLLENDIIRKKINKLASALCPIKTPKNELNKDPGSKINNFMNKMKLERNSNFYSQSLFGGYDRHIPRSVVHNYYSPKGKML